MEVTAPPGDRLASREEEIPASRDTALNISSDEDHISVSCESGSVRNSDTDKLDVETSLPRESVNVTTAQSNRLHEEVLANNPDAVSALMKPGVNVNAIDANGNTPLLLAGTNLMSKDRQDIDKYEKVVSILVEAGANVNEEPELSFRNFTITSSERRMLGKETTAALQTAAYLGSLTAVQLLVRSGADPLHKSKSGHTPTHQAASTGSEAILMAMLTPNLSDKLKLLQQVNVKDNDGCTPLHYAAATGSHECVECLIKHGANLSLRSRSGESAVEALFRQVPRPKSFMLSVLDSCISGSKDIPVGKRGYKVELDFHILCPHGYQTQTDILSALFTAKSLPTTRSRAIFKHPLVEAFICLKWHNLRWYFLAIFLIHLSFVLSLTSFVALQFYFRDGYDSLAIGSVRYVNLILSILVLATNIGQYSVRFKYYVRQYEAWTIGMSATISAIWTVASVFDYPGLYSGLETSLWTRHLLSVQLPLAWAGLMLLLGRFPIWGARALLFGLVLKNVLLTVLVLGFILIGFSLSFFVQFHDLSQEGFGNPWKSFANTVVMMTGEYGYLDIFDLGKSVEKLPFTSRFIFLCFVLVATVVLMNLIIGLAVADTQMLGGEGEWRCLKKKAESIDLLECLIPRLARRLYLPNKMEILIYGKTSDDAYQMSLILYKQTVQELINVAKREANKEAAKKRMAAEKVTITIPPAMQGSFEHEVFSTMEVLFRQISQLISNHTYSNSENENEAPGILRKNKNAFRKAVKKIARRKRKAE